MLRTFVGQRFGPFNRVVLAERLGSAPDARAYFLFSCKKKVAKENARPQRRPAFAGCSALLSRNGGLRNSGLCPSDSPRPFFPLRLVLLDDAKGQLKTKRTRSAIRITFRSVLIPPRAAPSNGGRPGAVGEDCLRAKPEFRPAGSTLGVRSRPASRVAQGSRRCRPRNAGVAFSLATFFWRPKRKYARASGAETSVSATPRCDR